MNKVLQTLLISFLFIFPQSVFGSDLKIAFFASSSENGYNQATWEGVKDAAAKAGGVDVSIFNELNVNFSKDVWNACVKFNIPLVYASSAATYGLGEFGYKDDHAVIEKHDVALLAVFFQIYQYILDLCAIKNLFHGALTSTYLKLTLLIKRIVRQCWQYYYL